MAKRHRRTKAEMQAFRAAEAERKARKYLNKIDKKLESNPQVIGVRPVEYKVTDPNDPNTYDFCDFIGTEEEANEFMKNHPEYDFIGNAPYLYEGMKFRITYWKKK
jgi:hypothetical protein